MNSTHQSNFNANNASLDSYRMGATPITKNNQGSNFEPVSNLGEGSPLKSVSLNLNIESMP